MPLPSHDNINKIYKLILLVEIYHTKKEILGKMAKYSNAVFEGKMHCSPYQFSREL